MLEIQKFIREHGIGALKTELGINVYEHPTLPLVGCKYSQIDSPRTHPVVREARGIVLEKDTWRVIAKPFNRFFNVGEVADEFAQFNWDDFTTVDKADGSLIILYWYDGEWHVNTSGSFGLGQAPNYNGTWRDLFWRFAGFNVGMLGESYEHTFIFELCTPWNKVVKTYKTPTVFLLGVNYQPRNDKYAPLEWTEKECDAFAEYLGVRRPQTYSATSRDSVAELIRTMEDDSGEIHEGVIIRDSNGVRYKWKTANYVALHRLKDNGNIIQPKRLTQISLTGETPEVLAVMPEIRTALTTVELTLAKAEDDILELWKANMQAKTQKEFALAVKDHKFSWVLFQLRKGPPGFPIYTAREYIRKIFRDNNDKVASTLFGKTTFTFDIEVEDEENHG